MVSIHHCHGSDVGGRRWGSAAIDLEVVALDFHMLMLHEFCSLVNIQNELNLVISVIESRISLGFLLVIPVGVPTDLRLGYFKLINVVYFIVLCLERE